MEGRPPEGTPDGRNLQRHRQHDQHGHQRRNRQLLPGEGLPVSDLRPTAGGLSQERRSVAEPADQSEYGTQCGGQFDRDRKQHRVYGIIPCGALVHHVVQYSRASSRKRNSGFCGACFWRLFRCNRFRLSTGCQRRVSAERKV